MCWSFINHITWKSGSMISDYLLSCPQIQMLLSRFFFATKILHIKWNEKSLDRNSRLENVFKAADWDGNISATYTDMYFNSLLLVNRGDVDDFSAILKVAEAVGIFRERTNHKQEKKEMWQHPINILFE